MEYKVYCTNQQIATVFLNDAKKNETFMYFVEVSLLSFWLI